MKRIFEIAFLLLLLGACKDPMDNECEGTDCPLPDGTYCTGNTVNIDNNCVCPEGSVMLNDSLCYDTLNNENYTVFYDNLNCSCINSDVIFGFENLNNINFSGGISLNENYHPHENNRIHTYLNLYSGSISSNFDASLYPFGCGINNNLKIHGSISNDTLTYFFYFTGGDTCATQQIVAL